jgi:hypothetical protein
VGGQQDCAQICVTRSPACRFGAFSLTASFVSQDSMQEDELRAVNESYKIWKKNGE